MSYSLSNSAAAVLGMLALGARSGYEIKRAGERSLRFFWALGPPQIYAELRRLEEARLISGTDASRGQRARRSYRVTAAGRRALHGWLTASGTGQLELRDPEFLRLFFADALEPDEVRARIAAMRDRAERALEHFDREVMPAADRTAELGHTYPREVARFGVELQRFIVDWCERFEREGPHAA
jgi:DNA-binding PadR family transcriptional regulator